MIGLVYWNFLNLDLCWKLQLQVCIGKTTLGNWGLAVNTWVCQPYDWAGTYLQILICVLFGRGPGTINVPIFWVNIRFIYQLLSWPSVWSKSEYIGKKLINPVHSRPAIICLCQCLKKHYLPIASSQVFSPRTHCPHPRQHLGIRLASP